MDLIKLKDRLCQDVLGAEDHAELLLVALLAQGHILIEGEPGIGKSSLANSLASSIHASNARIQFTPDLMPSDILGYSIVKQATKDFEFIAGPIFNNIVLADEINRTSPRIQSALLEAMNEQQVSIDGISHELPSPFMVIATQNSLQSIGTYPLPEAQLDRFILSINMELPKLETQRKILQSHLELKGKTIASEITAKHILEHQKNCLKVQIVPKLQDYILNLCEATRQSNKLHSSLSIRASISFMRTCQALAYLNGREAVYPEDIQKLFIPCLAHRFLNPSHSDLKAIQAILAEILVRQDAP